MTRLLKTLVGAAMVAALAMFSTPTDAALLLNVGSQIRIENGPGSPGGEFIVRKSTDFSPAVLTPEPLANAFKTFCVQTQESLGFGPIYTVGGISTSSTLLGGTALNFDTAGLYKEFMNNVGAASFDFFGVVGATYTNGSASSANALQWAIWELQGQVMTGLPTLSVASTTLKNAYKAAVAAQGLSSIGDIRILNLFTSTGGHAQDVLIDISRNRGNAIPEPSSLAIFGFLVTGMVARARRRK